MAVLLAFICLFHFSFRNSALSPEEKTDSLRALYERPTDQWPVPTVDSGVNWQELKALPETDSKKYFSEIQKAEAILGKNLFFDPILSASNQISCSSCHNPQTSWADKNSVSIGHDHAGGKRNTPSLLNVAQRKLLFWDGRSATLEEQAKNPIEAHEEMAMNINKLPAKLNKIKAYKKLFKDAYGTDKITFDHVTRSLASFQRTITSRRSRFDRFLDGEYKQLSDEEIQGLHLFRTKARCINCHNGQFFTDESFHNIGLTYYKREYQDLGRYNVTKDPNDVGKFRTPSLRDVMNTNPWMHNGLFDNIGGVLNMYNAGMQSVSATEAQKAADPMYPVTDPLLKKLNLTKEEKNQVIAFLQSITATQYKMPRPEKLPRD